MNRTLEELNVGDELPVITRAMTRERMRWYCDALETTAIDTGEFVIAEPTIHSDDEFALSQGLPGIIADGMISTNWLSHTLHQTFGTAYLRTGELQTKFIRPIYEDEAIETHAKVTEIAESGDGITYAFEVWCSIVDGDKCTVGSARVTV